MPVTVAAAEASDPIDILVDNAGFHIPSRFVDYRFGDFKGVIERRGGNRVVP